MDEMEELRKEHNRIEKENRHLTEYIGQLTKNLAKGPKSDGSRPSSSAGKNPNKKRR